jgi:hypothetical protein
MTEYTREILSLYVKPGVDTLRNIVTRVTWRWIARDEASYADLYKDTYFEAVDPNNFLDYSDLTDTIVFSWIDSVEDIVEIRAQLDQRLESAKNPVMLEKKIPWQSQSKYTGEEEYLLVFDDQPNDSLKIWGPMRWNSNRANNGLRERDVADYEFPTDVIMYQRGLLPESTPIIVTDRVKLYRVQYTEQPVLDDRFQYHEGLTWVVDSGEAVGTYFVIDRELSESKTIMQQQLSNESFQRQVSGVTWEVDGQSIEVNTDVVTRVNLMQRWQFMDDSDVISHKINNTTWKMLTKSQASDLLQILHDHINTCLTWERQVFDQIESAVTVAELKVIEI